VRKGEWWALSRDYGEREVRSFRWTPPTIERPDGIRFAWTRTISRRASQPSGRGWERKGGEKTETKRETIGKPS
jgi:hypothetical protein